MKKTKNRLIKNTFVIMMLCFMVILTACNESKSNEHKHDLVYHAAVNASCTANGNIEYWSCSGCDKIFSDEKASSEIDNIVIPATHTGGTEIRNVKEATEAEEGYTGDTHCLGCGVKLESGSAIDKLPHSHKTVKVDKLDPTCSVAGNIEHWVCSGCNKKFADENATAEINNITISATHTGGTEICGAKAATEFEEGYTGDTYCLGCGQELASGSTIRKLDHTHVLSKVERVDASCTTTGTMEHWNCSICQKNYTTEDATTEVANVIIPLTHTGKTEIRDAKAATEEETGYTGDTYCLSCGKKIKNGSVIPKLPHTHKTTKVNKVDPTCTTVGNIEYWICSVCQKKFSDEKATVEVTNITIPASHIGGTEIRDAKAATEHEEGYTGDTYCLGCEKKISDGQSIPKLNHTHKTTKVDGVNSTCSKDGNIEYWTCTGCGKKFSDASATVEVTNVIIPAAHTGGTEIRNAKEATEEEEGYTGDTHCLGCGVKLASGTSIAKLPHTHKITKVERTVPTCNKNGNIEHWICTGCGKKFSDASATTEITNISIPAAHTGGTEIRNAKEPTEDEEGYTGDVHCLGCGAKLSSGTFIPTVLISPAIVVNNASVAPGEDTVKVTVSVVNNPGISSLKFDIKFDSILSIESIEFDSAWGAYITAPKPYSNPQTINWISPFENNYSNGDMITITFKVSPEATANTTADIQVICDAGNIFDETMSPVAFKAVNGTVTIQK